jgi:hypothetical protein
MQVLTRRRATRILIVAAASVPLMLAGVAALISVLIGQSCSGGTGLADSPSRVAQDTIPANFLAIYESVGARYRIPWEVLAGIGEEECDHGRNPDPSCTPQPGATGPGVANCAGASGPMQIGVGGGLLGEPSRPSRDRRNRRRVARAKPRQKSAEVLNPHPVPGKAIHVEKLPPQREGARVGLDRVRRPPRRAHELQELLRRHNHQVVTVDDRPRALAARQHNKLRPAAARRGTGRDSVGHHGGGHHADPAGRSSRSTTRHAIGLGVAGKPRPPVTNPSSPTARPSSRPAASLLSSVTESSQITRRQPSSRPGDSSLVRRCGRASGSYGLHLIPRSLGGCGDPLCVVPACRRCHRAYDRGELDLVPYLEPAWRPQLAHAVGHVGLIGALRRISGGRRDPTVGGLP